MDELTLEKISSIYKEMIKNGNTKEEIIQNIFINYSTFIDNNQVIFNHKKIISKNLNTDFHNIFLIGSRHIGLKIEDNELKIKKLDDTTDYDYAIIDPFLFSKYFDEHKSTKSKYFENLCNGMLHPMYNKNLKKYIEDKISDCFGKVSVCIYLSEKSFLKKLYSFYGEKIFEEISKIIMPEEIETLK